MPVDAQQQAAREPGAAQTGVVVLTGDSWRDGDKVFRLYGVQSCLRGAFYTDRAGNRQDCGAVSAAILAAFLRDTRPQCKPVAQIKTPSTTPTTLVACSAHIGTEELDLGSILIAQGFAFAALTDRGQPVYKPYLAQESLARQGQKGLWAFKDFHPPEFRQPEPIDQPKL